MGTVEFYGITNNDKPQQFVVEYRGNYLFWRREFHWRVIDTKEPRRFSGGFNSREDAETFAAIQNKLQELLDKARKDLIANVK